MSKMRKTAKSAMAERHTGWSRKAWHSKPKHQWRSVLGRARRKSSKLHGKLKEVSLEMNALGSALKEKTQTWKKSCKEKSQKRNRVIQDDGNRRKRRKARGQQMEHHQENTKTNS